MIYFQTEDQQIDLSHLKITLTQESDLFTNDMRSGYSLPFSAGLDSQIAIALGFPDLKHCSSMRTAMEGTLVVDGQIFQAHIRLGQLRRTHLELTLFYDQAVLQVYKLHLGELEWPLVGTPDLTESAAKMLAKSYPEVTHNWPLIYRPQISQKQDYEAFMGFVNHYRAGRFIQNQEVEQPPFDLGTNGTAIDGDYGRHFRTRTNTMPTIISQMLNPRDGVFYLIQGGGDAFASKIYRSTTVKLQGPEFEARKGHYLWLFYDGKLFIEVDRGSELPVFGNFNVMQPCVYLLEVLRRGFALEGKQLRGGITTDTLLQKTLVVPDRYMEQFAQDTFQSFSFDEPTGLWEISGQNYNQFLWEQPLERVGSYLFKMDLELSASQATFFNLAVFSRSPAGNNSFIHFSQNSENENVELSIEVPIDVTLTSQYDRLIVTLLLPLSTTGIAAQNACSLRFEDGRLNEFPGLYSLADYMPDMRFGTLVNLVKNWLNLKIRFVDDVVYMDYMEQQFEQIVVEDLSETDHPDYGITLGSDRVFRLAYANGQALKLDREGVRNGAVSGFEQQISLQAEVHPLEVKRAGFTITGVYEDTKALRLCLYDQLQSRQNSCVPQIGQKNLSIQNRYDLCWKKWLQFRTRAKLLKETFVMPAPWSLDLEQPVFKHGEIWMLKKVRQRWLGDDGGGWEIEVEGESL